MKMLIDEYQKNLSAYYELENTVFPDYYSDEDLLTALICISDRKSQLQKSQNDILNALLVPFESHEKGLTEDEALLFQNFADDLSGNTISKDSAIALRINLMLLEYGKHTENFDIIVHSIYGCGIDEWHMYLSSERQSFNTHFSLIRDYGKYYGRLSQTGKSYYIRSLCNVLLQYSNQNADILIKEGESILAEIHQIESEFGTLPIPRNKVYISVYRNIMTSVTSFRNGIGSFESRMKVYKYSQAALALYRENSEENASDFTEWRTYIFTQYHAGIISLQELLEHIEKISLPDDSLSPIENCIKLLIGTASYIEYFQLYSGETHEKICSLTKERVDSALEKAGHPEIGEMSYIVYNAVDALLSVSFDVLDINDAIDILLQITVFQHKPTLVHTLIVEMLCEMILKHILAYDPSVLDGVLGYHGDDIKEHEFDILEDMKISAFLHDAGKYKCFSVISNFGRSLEDIEFISIRRHPQYGYDYLQHSSISQAVKDCVLLHHKWHNGMGGYPSDIPQTENQPLVDILSVADSLDAATDPFGRPYSRSKTIVEIIAELNRERDTRYAGFVIDIIEKECMNELEDILNRKRREIICEVWKKRPEG